MQDHEQNAKQQSDTVEIVFTPAYVETRKRTRQMYTEDDEMEVRTKRRRMRALDASDQLTFKMADALFATGYQNLRPGYHVHSLDIV
jgi:hypothetical protein